VRLALRFQDDETGVHIKQSIEAGFSGFGEFLDPFWRLVFPARFARAKDENVRTEFPRLRDLLHQDAA
jgi:hypothetical protein